MLTVPSVDAIIQQLGCIKERVVVVTKVDSPSRDRDPKVVKNGCEKDPKAEN